MCGIAGIVGRMEPSDLAQHAQSLLQQLEHRGPDDAGWGTWGPAGFRSGRTPMQSAPVDCLLLHRRLSILDLTESGWQPMSSPDGRFHITFNGEIYNYRELRDELIRLGHRFRSTTDTEVLLAAYARWGREALTRLTGMFAFAIVDTLAGKVFLARDCFGIKPLYYFQAHGRFAFSSEIRSLLRLPGINRKANPSRLLDYLSSGLTDHGGDTLFAAIQQLPAAHCLEIDVGHPAYPVTPSRYWQIDLSERRDISFDEAKRELRERFLKSIALHLRSDVPVGAALSGGIDSSAIVMAMRHLQGDSLDIHSFSYVARDTELNEENWVDLVTKSARTTAHKVHAQPGELLDDLATLVRVQDVPFGSTSIYAQHRVFRLAREAGIKVMLDGQGADELFAGYRGYLGARTASLLRQGQYGGALKFLKRMAKLPGVGLKGMLFQVRGLPQLAGLRRCMKALVRGRSGQPWLRHEWFAERDAFVRHPESDGSADVLREELHRTLMRTSLPQLLRYEDRNSMAFSIESRVPFLTADFAEFVLSLPEEYFISPEGTSKWIFREAMRGIVPDAILDRRDKIGFATPENRWLEVLKPQIDTLLASDTAQQIPALNLEVVRRHWQAIKKGRRRIDYQVWRWVNVIEWARQYDVVFN